jgi:hypothetical protein
MRSNLLYFLLVCLIAIGCNKDSEFENEVKSQPPVTENLNTTKSSVQGLVYDLNNQPVANAEVRTFFTSTRTDENGVFKLVNTDLDPHGTYLTVTKEGFMHASDKVFPTSGTSYSSIQMINLDFNTGFNTETGGTIEVENGGSLIFQPGGIINSDGNPYTGKVNVTSHFISPNDNNIGDIMPGDMTADDAMGNTMILGTAGMMAVDLRDNNGNRLNLAQGATATIKFPKVNANHPNEIPLWSFDEVIGRWQEEGIATTEGDSYVATVSHFSFWNCDVPFPLITLCGKVVTQNGMPVRTRIDISTSDFGTMWGYTDSNGEFCGKVPRDAELTIRVKDVFCLTTAAVEIKGGFANDVVLDDIVIEDLIPNIQGEVQCLEEVHDNATVLLRTDQKTFVVNNLNEGIFNINVNALCVDITGVSIIAFNLEDNMASEEQTVDLNSTIYHELEVCLSPCDFEGEFIYECGNEEMGIQVINGTGGYNYSWDTGSTDQTITLNDGSFTYCVIIEEELSGCTKEYCKRVGSQDIRVSGNQDPCFGDHNFFISYGVAPFTITFDNGTVIDDHNFINFSFFGSGNGETICYNLVDQNGCTFNDCFVSEPFSDFPWVDAESYGCDKNRYYFSSTDFAWGIVYDGIGNDYPVNYPFELNVLETGYAVKKATLYNNEGCESDNEIRLPFFRGITEVIVSNTSCMGCEDGHIQPIIDPDAECIDCAYGEIKIYKSGNLLDVTPQNNDEALPAGEYYVVALDSTSQCFIAHELVEVE